MYCWVSRPARLPCCLFALLPAWEASPSSGNRYPLPPGHLCLSCLPSPSSCLSSSGSCGWPPELLRKNWPSHNLGTRNSQNLNLAGYILCVARLPYTERSLKRAGRGRNMFLQILQLLAFSELGLGQLRLRCLERRRLHLVSPSCKSLLIHWSKFLIFTVLLSIKGLSHQNLLKHQL